MITGLTIEIAFKIITVYLCSKWLACKKSALRFMFILISVESIVTILINTILLSHSDQHLTATNPSNQNIIYLAHLQHSILQALYLGIFLIFAFRQANITFNKFLTTLPTLITILFSIAYSVAIPFTYLHTYAPSLWTTPIGMLTIMTFGMLIYSLPLTKNIYVRLWVISFLMLITSNIFLLQSNNLLHKYNMSNINYWLWTCSNLLFIFSFYSLNRNKNINKWFQQAGNIQAQLGYWSTSIISSLFILLLIKHIVIKDSHSLVLTVFTTNLIVYIPFASLLTIIAILLSKYFVHDFIRLSQVHNDKNRFYFKETKRLSLILSKEINKINKQERLEENILASLKLISQKLIKPINLLLNIGQQAGSQLKESQQDIQRNALLQIKGIANELESSTKTSGIKNITDSKINYITALLVKYIQEKELLCSKATIKLTYSIAPKAWFQLSTINTNELYRVISNLINNAIEACEYSAKKRIKLEINYADNPPSYYLIVKDSGTGMTQEQIQKALSQTLTTTKKTGHGLGLQHAVNAINNWGGRLKISSALNEGTEINIALPTIEKPPTWWTNALNSTGYDSAIILESDTFHHQLWDSILTIPVIHCYSAIETLHSMQNDHKQLLLLNVNNATYHNHFHSVILAKKLENNTYIITTEYNSQWAQVLCQNHHLKLLPKPLLPYINIIN